MEIDWGKYGFKEALYIGNISFYQRSQFPLTLGVLDNYLIVFYSDKTTSVELSRGKIPATNQSVVLLLKAFNCPKLP